MRRELGTGLVLGGLLGSIGFLRIMVWQTFFPLYGEHCVLLALTVAASLIGVVTFGTLAGSLLPFVLRSLKFDPASASASHLFHRGKLDSEEYAAARMRTGPAPITVTVAGASSEEPADQ
jgi:hypothetical protein